jgi:hypothetical protein
LCSFTLRFPCQVRYKNEIPTLRPPEEKRDFAAQKAAKPVLRKENEAKHAKQKNPCDDSRNIFSHKILQP